MVVTLGRQYNIGKSPPLYCTFTLIAMQRHQKNREGKVVPGTSSNIMVVIIYCYMGYEDEVTTLKREQRDENREDHDVDIFDIIQKVQETVIHLEVDEEQWKMLFKENQNTPRPSEHPPVMGGKMSKRLGGIKGCKYKTSSWHLNRFPDADNIGSTV